MNKVILFVIGTRPEGIKMLPIYIELKKRGLYKVFLCTTGQHRKMLDQVLIHFDVTADYDLNVMTESQTLLDLTSKILYSITNLLSNLNPDMVLVHGDTTTTFATSLACFYSNVKIGHVEAGLRTNDLKSPWPEEFNRQCTSIIADLHFSPTELSAKNLIKENIPQSKIFITGNTVIDALFFTINKIDNDHLLNRNLFERFKYINFKKKLILVTAHRRENHEFGIENICCALKSIALNHNVQIVFPVHLNPAVREPVGKILSNTANIHLIEPLDYLEFTFLMMHSFLILTDSGGVQEEAPSLNVPVLVTRNNTERPEVLLNGSVKLVGTDVQSIIDNVDNLLLNSNLYNEMRHKTNPFGNGNSSIQIVDIISSSI